MKAVIVLGVGCPALALSALAAPSAMASHYPLDTVSANKITGTLAANWAW